MNRKKPLKAEQSSDRMISLLRKEKRDNFEVLTRTGNIRIEKPVNGVQIKEKDKLKMFRTPGKHGKFMQPIIDVSEFENLQIVHKKVIDNLGFKKRYENSFLEQFDKKQEESIDDDKKNQNSYIGAGNFSNVQEIYIAKEKERQKQKRYKKMLKIQKQKQQEEEEDAYKNADGDKENKNKSLNINSKNPYIINKEKNDQIYKQLYIFTRDRNTINKLTQNKNYKNDLNISRQDVQTAKAVGKRRERFNSETFYGQAIAHGFTTTHKSQQNNFYRQEYDEVLEENLPIFLTDQQEVKEEQQYAFEQYERQCIISMVSGQPVNPYISLPTLQEQLENKNKHFKFESKKFFDDLDLQQMPEFEGFDFQEAKKQEKIQKKLNTSQNLYQQSKYISVNNLNTNHSNQNQNQNPNNSKILQLNNSYLKNQNQSSLNISHLTNNNNNNITSFPSSSLNKSNIQEIKFTAPQNQSLNQNQSQKNNRKKISLSQHHTQSNFNSQQFHNLKDYIMDYKSLKQKNLENFKQEQISVIKSYNNNSNNNKHENSILNNNYLQSNQSSQISDTQIKNYYSNTQFQTNNNISLQKQKQNSYTKIYPKRERSYNQTDKEYLKRMGLKNIEKNKNREEQAQQLIKNTIEQEGQVIQTQKDFYNLKEKKNLEFNKYIKTIQRDRPLTSQIRKRVYYPDPRVRTNQLNNFRVISENERKKKIKEFQTQIDWYLNLLKQVSEQVEQNKNDNREIPIFMLNSIKAIIESMQCFSLFYFYHILEVIENNPTFFYNILSIEVVRLVGKYLIEQQKGTKNYFESYDALAEKEFQNMIKHRKKLYQYYGNQYNISLTIQNIKGQTNNINNKSSYSRKSIQQRSISHNIPTQESQI